jgi:cytoskeletal protein RodZ
MPVVLGVLVILVIIGVVVALAAGVGKHTASPPTTARHGSTSGNHKSKTTTTSSTTTSTTAPPSVVPEASTATAAAATYVAPVGNYAVNLTSSGPCWVYAKVASTGAVLWTGTLDQGQAQQLSATGEIIVQLGHANTMSVTLNGVPVQYPTPFQAVFTMTFLPST